MSLMSSKIVECSSVYVKNKAFKYLSHQYFIYTFKDLKKLSDKGLPCLLFDNPVIDLEGVHGDRSVSL